jgi:hypothetical protein
LSPANSPGRGLVACSYYAIYSNGRVGPQQAGSRHLGVVQPHGMNGVDARRKQYRIDVGRGHAARPHGLATEWWHSPRQAHQLRCHGLVKSLSHLTWQTAPPSAVVADLSAVLVGTASSAAIVFTAAKAAGVHRCVRRHRRLPTHLPAEVPDRRDRRPRATQHPHQLPNSLSSALADKDWRKSAVVTFLATASEVTLLGTGSACWGLLAGVLTALVIRSTRKASVAEQTAGAATAEG